MTRAETAHAAAQLLRPRVAGAHEDGGHGVQGSASADHRRRTHVRHLSAQGRRDAERHDLPAARLPKGQRLPMIVWAYPREFVDAEAASQVVGSPNRFTTVGGSSHLLLLAHGYAIFDGPTMPIVGPGETANDTYVEQLVVERRSRGRQGGRARRRRSRPHRRRRPQLWRVHDREPARALGPVRRRRRAQRCLQPHADAVRVPGRDAHLLGGPRTSTPACRRSTTRTRSTSRSC